MLYYAFISKQLHTNLQLSMLFCSYIVKSDEVILLLKKSVKSQNYQVKETHDF